MSSDSHSHLYHIVSPSPWPFLVSFALAMLMISVVVFLHYTDFFGAFALSFFVLLSVSLGLWWSDVIREGVSDGAHNYIVRRGLKIGMATCIIVEAMFFFGLFFSLFKSWLLPVQIVENLWDFKGFISWPPAGITPVDPWNIPFLNTLILLLSGLSVNWAHASVISGDKSSTFKGLLVAVLLGIAFLLFQAYEYSHIDFGIHADGYGAVYSSNFYIITGFHGLHVLIGVIFLSVCVARSGRYTSDNHLGLQFAAWYWHFVDAVWILLFIFLYVLGS